MHFQDVDAIRQPAPGGRLQILNRGILHALERQPFDRYPTAAAMKLELDAPEKVQVTGRSERLRPPTMWQGRWQKARMYVLAMLVPVLTVVILYLLFHKK